MQAHRLIASLSPPSFVPFVPPFSCFEYVDHRFSGLTPLHRCFSLARSFDAKTLVEERLPPAGIIAQENEELVSFGLACGSHDVYRLSFWRRQMTRHDVSYLTDDDLIGYVILKRDTGKWGGADFDRWHVFEAVFRKYAHDHNCLPNAGLYSLRVADHTFSIQGVLYCQQNGLNKACAHVALRSLLSRLVAQHDVPYSVMNEVAQKCLEEGGQYQPSNGLTVPQIQTILKHFDIPFCALDYDETSQTDPEVRVQQPYQKYLYSGIESGVGGLLGFSMDGPEASRARHIIPFYGHTFNKDTWAPDADVSYFNIGANVGYVPSESWTSSFLGHDDNFGSNFCIPRLYVKPENVQYVVELLKKDAQYNGMVAEAIALQLLYSLGAYLDVGNPWQARLARHVRSQKVVLRAFCVERQTYLDHLRRIRDWDGRSEQEGMLSVFESTLPLMLWIVEFSIPQLFPANERKLGEIVLNACCSPEDIFAPFILARLPGTYLMLADIKTKSYERVSSELLSHVEVMRQNS